MSVSIFSIAASVLNNPSVPDHTMVGFLESSSVRPLNSVDQGPFPDLVYADTFNKYWVFSVRLLILKDEVFVS